MRLTVDGTDAYAYTGGKPFDPALPCVAFIHGALNDHSVWTLLARWCAHQGYGVLALDLPGHGRSTGAPLASVEASGSWLHRLLDAAGVEQAALVGHSMGSLIALEAAERATALVMVGTAYPMKVSDALLSTACEQPQQAIDMVTAFSHSLASAKPSFPGPGAWLRGGSTALKRRIQAQQPALNLFEHDFKLCDTYANAEAAAARVACPTTLILGALDQMTSPKQTALLEAWLKPRVHRLPAGHELMAEAPDAMLAALRQALPALPQSA
ncbi:MAG: alpha/beta fold hydrolase [Rubrivivax sp.]|nr:MAG: alpha/beta fold hydrolase [Rubrivivax sp.]